MDERKKSAVERAADEKLTLYGGALGGMLVGESLNEPISTLVQDIKMKKKLKYADPHKVVPITNFMSKGTLKDYKKNRMMKFLPKPGFPKSKGAIVGGIVGSTMAPIAVAQIRENREQNQFISDLEKEACELYTNLPKIEKPKYL